MNNAIEIKNLHKSFGDVKAVNDLSFKVKEGELFAFLGVNGAGKSTTISVVCGLLEKDQGQVFINGEEVNGFNPKTCEIIGVVFQESVLDRALTVKDNLKYRGACYGLDGKDLDNRMNELTALLHLQSILNHPVAKLSGGERRRTDIARALLNRPKILILDEPTTGLDPQTRKLVWGVIEKLRREENMTVLLTTHYMEEATDADYVVIMDGGRVVAEGSPVQLKNEYTGDFITLYVDEDKVKSLGLEYKAVASGFRIGVKDTEFATQLILKHPEVFTDYEIVKGKMDDVFLSVTGKNIGESEDENG